MQLVRLFLLLNCVFYTLHTANKRVPPDHSPKANGWSIPSLNPSETPSLNFSYDVEEIDESQIKKEYRDLEQSYLHLSKCGRWVDLELLHQEEKSQHNNTLPNFFDGIVLERLPQASPKTQMINHLLEKAKKHYDSLPKQEDAYALLPKNIHEDVEKYSPLDQLRWYGLRLTQRQQKFLDQDDFERKVAIFSTGSDSDVIKAAAQLAIKRH